MKFIFVVLVCLSSLMAANAKDAAFALDFEDNYKTALLKAQQENKVLMLVIVQDPCPYCDGLVEETFEDAKVKEALKDYVSVIVDRNSELPSHLKAPGAPMTFFVDAVSQESIDYNLGYASPEDFYKVLQKVNAHTVKKKK